MSIEVRNITKTFGDFVALRDVSLKVPTGELVALLGPSGSGKTTLLRIIAGLETPDPDKGQILFYDENVAKRDVGSRNVGFVFQHYALFRHMTVFENIAFGLRVRPRETRPSPSEIKDRVERLLKLVQLGGLARRYPSQLSGGQRQRVALARALAVEPKVLLLDEPFGALDAKVRQELRRWLRQLHDEIHVTSLFVTHDQEEALEVADRVVVMSKGVIEQVGSAEEVFHHPATQFVMQFLGNVNLFHGRVEDGKPVIVQGEGGAAKGKILVRPHQLDIDPNNSTGVGLRAKVTRVHSAGPSVKLELVTDNGQAVQVDLAHDRFRQVRLTVGDQTYVVPREFKVFAGDYSI